MKISVNKLLYYWFSKANNYKSKSVQISLRTIPYNTFIIDIDFLSFSHIFFIKLLIPFVFEMLIEKDKECDHAGFTFYLNILGLELEYCNRDIRHWDYENEKWEEYEK